MTSVLCLPCGAGGTFFVSPAGNDDANPGTRKEPFQTVARARDAVRPLLPAVGEDITVYLGDGIYRPEGPIEFTAPPRRFGPEMDSAIVCLS